FTVYPVSSNVKKDFFNLAEVYVDAVFHPQLARETFRREAHHFTLTDNKNLDSPLSIQGIVYSEMKGAYSAPESLIYRHICNEALAGTPMGRDSGGDPGHIPELNYEQFQQFHETYYHPGNALIFIYGDIPTREHLRFLAPTLAAYDRKEVPIPTPRQPKWSNPHRIVKAYPIGRTENSGARTFLSLSWLVGNAMDPAAFLEWQALASILLGDEAAPLKKAIIDAKLGADLTLAGAWGVGYEELFSVGLKGSEPDRANAFETLVLETLQRIASETIPSARVDAAFQQLTYAQLEVATLFPLHLMSRSNRTWPYGGDPLDFLRMDEHLDKLQKRYAADPQMFNRLIRGGLLDNPHRLLITLPPDKNEQSRADAAFAEKMSKQRAGLSAEKIAAIARDAAELEAAQGIPNPPEALAKLPQLKVSDLPEKPRHIPTELSQIAGFNVLRNNVFSNGINYLELSADLSGLPLDLYEYLPRYSDAIDKIGAAGQNYVRIAERRAACTDGLWCSLLVKRHVSDTSRSLQSIKLGLKTLDAQTENACRLLSDLVFGVDPRDRERLHDLQNQSRAYYQTALVNGATQTALRQAARGFTPEAALDHLFMSPKTLRFVDQFALNFDTHAEKLIHNIEQIRDFLLNRRRWTISFTGSDQAFAALTRTLEDWASRMGDSPVENIRYAFAPFARPPREGLACPIKVANCARVMPAPYLSHPSAPLLKLGVFLVIFDYCLPEIRFKGNAYNAGASFNDSTGTLRLYSGQDPRLVETIRVLERLRDFVNAADWTQTDINRAIIGSMKEVERPIRPGEATGQALNRHLRGCTNEFREKSYEATLRATPQDVKRVLIEQLAANELKAALCVVSCREKLEEANRVLGDCSLAISDLLT
ncbi:MAG: insulinase family protein, partial [Verrucomicrobia bacterium]|nr:insulinase family protein [Verrucomicrobiota bacterium]